MNTRSRLFPVVGLLAGMLFPQMTRAQPDKAPTSERPVLCLSNTRFLHPDSILYADLALDGRTFFTLSEKGVYAWDLETGDAQFLFTDGRIRNVLMVSPDGTQLLSISRDDVAVWDAKSGKEVRRFSNMFSAGSAAFRPDGKGVIVFREDRIEFRDWEGVTQIVGKTAPYRKPVFSSDHKWFAASAPGERAADLLIYNAQTLEKRATVNVGPSGFGSAPNGLGVVLAAFSPDGNLLAVPASDASIRLWDLGQSKQPQILKAGPQNQDRAEAEYGQLLFSSDGKQVFAGTAAGTVRRWDTESGQELAPLRSHRSPITSLHHAQGGKLLVSTCRDGVIRRWDTAAGREVNPPDGYIGSLHAHLGPDGKSVLLLDAAGRMDLWDLYTGRLRLRVRAPAKLALGTFSLESRFGFTADGSRVYLAETNGTITLWNTSESQAPGPIEVTVPPTAAAVYTSAFVRRTARLLRSTEVSGVWR